MKEGGKTLGKSVSDLTGKLIHTVRAKFKDVGMEGLLTRAEHDPTPKNIDKVHDELATHIEEDNSYNAQLQALVTQLAAAGVVRQVMANRLEVEDTLEAKSMTQKAEGGVDIKQDMLTETKAKNIKLGEMKQEA